MVEISEKITAEQNEGGQSSSAPVTTPEEARYFSHKHILESNPRFLTGNPHDGREAVNLLHVSYESWERVCTERGLELKKSSKEESKPKKGYKEESKSLSKKPFFNFPVAQLKKPIKTLDELKVIIENSFPTIWFETKTCLAAYISIVLKNLNGCPALVLVGNPSGEKTTVLSFFYGYKHSYISDEFTPRSFVSNSANVKAEELESIDLLPRIKDKVLITPELAPLFEAPKEDLLSSFAMLTRVLDGEGLNRDSGTHGHRGYSGDYKFIWLGATTPLRSSVWNLMGKMGNRLFFLSMSDKNRSTDDYVNMFQSQPYDESVKVCRAAVHSFLDSFFERYKLRSTTWGVIDNSLLKEIVKYGKLLAQLRGSLITWKSSEEKGDYEFSSPIIEEPPRAINALLNFAKGHALISDRQYLISEDLEIVKRICLSSMPHDRKILLDVLRKHGGRASSETLADELKCSNDTALRTMKVLTVLGVCDTKDLSVSLGRPVKFVELKTEFQELLISTQRVNGAEKSKPHEKRSAGAWENYENGYGARAVLSEENTFPQEIPVVLDRKVQEGDSHVV